MKLCVIDIGTNSLHAIFAVLHPNGTFEVLGKEKEMVRLGDHTLISGRLSKEVMDNAARVLRRFVHLAKHRSMDRVIAVATSAVREAQNGGVFLDRLRRETDLKVQVITGLEEARLIYLAVKNTMELGRDQALVVDIGGGTTEFVCANGQKCHWLDSVRLGANRLSQLMLLSNPPKKGEVKDLEKYVESLLKPILARLKKNKVKYVIGTSGTLNTLARMILDTSDEKLFSPRSHKISLERIVSQYKKLAGMTSVARSKVRGLDKKREDMIVHGIAIVKVLMDKAGIPFFTACDKALREGVLYDFIEKNRKVLNIETEHASIRKRSVMALLDKFSILKSHCEHAAILADSLFVALKKLHKLGESDRELLTHAALLHDIGYQVSFNRHHKHSFYLVMNADLAGFSLTEIQIIAWVCQFHRRSTPRKDKDFMALDKATQQQILKLAALLKIADALDHSHFGLVKSVKAKIARGKVDLTVCAADDVQWEVYEAGERQELFEKIFKRQLEFKIKIV